MAERESAILVFLINLIPYHFGSKFDILLNIINALIFSALQDTIIPSQSIALFVWGWMWGWVWGRYCAKGEPNAF